MRTFSGLAGRVVLRTQKGINLIEDHFEKHPYRVIANSEAAEKFVEKYPEKKGYFQLKNDITKFTFPEPGGLEGVKSLSKSIMKMSNVSYQYPSRDEPTIRDINLECSSRL